MAEKEPIIKEKLDNSGVFDFKAIYSFANSWLKDEGFGVVEDKYSEKVSGSSREISVEWNIRKEMSDYFILEGGVGIEVKGMTDVEVEIEGERKRMNKGKISISIKGALVTDPKSKWDENNFYRFLRDIYNKYIIPGRIEHMKSLVKEKIIAFKEELKAVLELSGRR